MSEKKEMVGMDRKFCPVYVGDTIIDASGVKYTISERGTCVNAAGKDYAFSDLHGPELCSVEAQQPAAVEDPAPKEKLFPAKRKGGKENKSGLVSLGSLARRLQVKQAGLARTLRSGGIEVVKGKNGYGIRIADVEKAERLLAPLKAALPEMKKIGLGDVLDASKQPDGPAVDFGAIEDVVGVDTAILFPSEKNPADLAEYDTDMLLGELKRRHVWPAIATTDTTHVFTKKDADLMLDDLDLAEMLRARGFEVTATKTVVVSL